MNDKTLEVVQTMFAAWESLDMEAVLQNWHEDGYLWSMICLLYTSPSPRDGLLSRMPSSA